MLCDQYWLIFIELFPDIFKQIHPSQAKIQQKRYYDLWCNKYESFVEQNKP